jgi:short-subunit dehydrogenase
MSYWKSKRCVITGGSSGLGLVLARELARREAVIVLNGRDIDRLAAAADELRGLGANVHTSSGDVSASGMATRLIGETCELLGGIDFVCHAAGRSMRGRLIDTSGDDFEALWRLNTRAAFELAKAAAGPLAQSRGHLVLVGSLASRIASRYLGAYPASKFPLAALAQQLRLEQGADGMHTLLVCPGPIRRDDTGTRYLQQAGNLPPEASAPGGGAKVPLLDPHVVCERILHACERRRVELVLPTKARWLFAISQLSPRWGDWLIDKFTKG